MRTRNKLFISIVLTWVISIANGQVITYTPEYPTINDTIEITFDASLGNGDLSGTPQVFLHTGVITDFSNNGADWQYIRSLWNSGYDSVVAMTNIGSDKHTIRFKVKDLYYLNSSSRERMLALVIGMKTALQ